MYVVDETHRVVHVMASQTCRVVHTWRELPDPRGLAIDLNGRTLYVTNGVGDSVSAIDIGSVTPVGTLGPSQALKDATLYRSDRDLQVGRGPYGAARKPDGPVLFVANALENSCTVINTSTFQVTTTFPIGFYPQDVAATLTFTGIGYFAYITCLGGGEDIAGSVALYWDRPNGLQANITGFTNPKGIIYDFGAAAWITNSGGESVSQLTLAVAGGSFAATILPNITATVGTGKNPVDVTIEPWFTYFTLVPRAVLTADRGSSQITVLDPRQPSRPRFTMPMTGVSSIAGYMDQ
jgi:YVTN family beta-propeller protein